MGGQSALHITTKRKRIASEVSTENKEYKALETEARQCATELTCNSQRLTVFARVQVQTGDRRAQSKDERPKVTATAHSC